MKKYWLYLESYTFIFKGIQGYLIFNSITNQNFLVSVNDRIAIIIEKLLDPNNMYCIEIFEEEIKQVEISEFIQKLRESFSGDIIRTNLLKRKPINLIPKPSVMKSVGRLNNDPLKSPGENLLSYLHQLYIYVSGECSLKCKLCYSLYKQTFTCSKFRSELSFHLFEALINNLRSSSLYEINIGGGNILKYSYWNNICQLLKIVDLKVVYHNNYLNFLANTKCMLSIGENSIICLLVPGSFLKSELLKSIQIIYKARISCKVKFLITNYAEYRRSLDFCQSYNIINYEILPIYTGSNLHFFRGNVFINIETILSYPTSKKEIFSKMTLNLHDFGKLIIMPNGDVFANINLNRIGNLNNDTLYEVLYKEMINGKSWFRIRKMEPCNKCTYQWLCPPLSNYELIFNKSNLCNIL